MLSLSVSTACPALDVTHGSQHDHHDYPPDRFPFAYELQRDPFTGREDGLMVKALETGTAPKLYCFISRAAAMTGSSSQIETTCPVMISLISIFPRSFVRSAISIVPKRGKYSPAD